MDSRLAMPDKKYFKIGEVADLVGVEPHVLRYWETQFPQVRPHKARSGHRLYRRREVETLLVIRELLHVQRFTIAGARQALRQPGGPGALLPRFFAASDPLAGPSSDAPLEADGAAFVGGRADERAGDEDADDAAGDAADVDAIHAGALHVDDDHTNPNHANPNHTNPDRAHQDHTDADGEPVLSDEGSEAWRAAPGHDVAPRDARVDPAVLDGGARADVARPAGSIVGLMGSGAASLDARRRALLEHALADARAILGVLDRDDARARLHP